MVKLLLALGMAVALFASAAHGLDWPIKLKFQLGFAIHVVPAPNDMSHDLGLAVVADKVYSDKTHTLSVSGTITNIGPVQRDGIEMHLAVTSYVGTGASFGRAAVEPASLPPGASASFSAHIPLDSEKPQFAKYTITAQSPAPAVVIQGTTLPNQ